MRISIQRAGFSLLEVVLATGIFATAVTVMLALLPALTRRGAAAEDLLVAQVLPDSLRVELRRLAVHDFNGLAVRVPVMSSPLMNGMPMVASHDGSRLHTTDYLPPAASLQLPEEQRYFAIEAWRFDQGSLRYDGGSMVLAVYVRVSWPCYLPGSSTPTPLAARSQLTFTVSLPR